MKPSYFFSLFPVLALCEVLFFACSENKTSEYTTNLVATKTKKINESSQHSLSLQYAENFSIDTLSDHFLGLSVRICSKNDTVESRYLLRLPHGARELAESDKTIIKKSLPKVWRDMPVIALPVSKVILLSGSYYAYFKRLGKEKVVIGFSDKKQTADSALFRKIEVGQVREVGDGQNISEEKLFALHPDLVVSFAVGNAFDADFMRLKQTGIPVLLTSEWQEPTPLARAEWIRLFGVLTQSGKADSLFQETAKQYEQLKKEIQETYQQNGINCIPVFAGTPTGGMYFIPTDSSFTATFIQDAGGCLVFKNEHQGGHISPEQAFLYGKTAPIWLHPGYGTPEEILAADSRAADFKAFQKKQIFNFDKRQGISGALDFYESVVVFPDSLLREMFIVLQSAIAEIQTETREPTSPVSNSEIKNSENANADGDSLFWYRNIFYN